MVGASAHTILPPHSHLIGGLFGLAAMALALCVAVPAISAFEAWQIDSAGLLAM